MNKKKIGALLVGATLLVGAMGSFAYFTSQTSIGGRGEDGLLQKLEIQNGKVVIKADVANRGEGLSDWTYDVAKYSSDTNSKETGIQLPMSMTDFEDMHRSPDISVADEENGKEDVEVEIDGKKYPVSRAKIGAALPTEIQYTRPGDAIVLGTAKTNSTEANGLVISNESNLTIRLRLKVKDSDKAKEQLEAMQAAGWKLYINGRETSIFGDEETLNVDGEQIVLDNLKDGINLGIIAGKDEDGKPGTIDPVDVRFELPLDRDNNYQDLTAAGGTKGTLNLNDLIEIQATQENNHNWADLTE